MNKTPEEIYDEYKLGELPIIKSAVIHAMEAYASQFESAGLREALHKLQKSIISADPTGNDTVIKDLKKQIDSILAAASKEERGKEERTFTLKEALEIAQHFYEERDRVLIAWSDVANSNSVKTYFKEKFNIKIL